MQVDGGCGIGREQFGRPPVIEVAQVSLEHDARGILRNIGVGFKANSPRRRAAGRGIVRARRPMPPPGYRGAVAITVKPALVTADHFAGYGLCSRGYLGLKDKGAAAELGGEQYKTG